MKINVSLSDELLEKADAYRKENYLTRSALISVALNQYINAQSFKTQFPDFIDALRKVSKNGEVDAETEKALKDMDVIVKAINAGA